MTPATEVTAIVEAYVERRLSYEGVAREFDTSSTRVQSIMRKHAPGSIRARGNPAGHKAAPLDGGLTLASLGLYQVGRCTDCGTPMVSETQERGQACGFCKVAGRAA